MFRRVCALRTLTVTALPPPLRHCALGFVFASSALTLIAAAFLDPACLSAQCIWQKCVAAHSAFGERPVRSTPQCSPQCKCGQLSLWPGASLALGGGAQDGQWQRLALPCPFQMLISHGQWQRLALPCPFLEDCCCKLTISKNLMSKPVLAGTCENTTAQDA